MLVKFADINKRVIAVNPRSITMIEPDPTAPTARVFIWSDATGQPARSIIVDGTVDLITAYIARQQAQAAVTPPRPATPPSTGRSAGPRR